MAHNFTLACPGVLGALAERLLIIRKYEKSKSIPSV
jgi:non-ribosomal peptide synthetase component E (peptide arylation enzyme)